VEPIFEALSFCASLHPDPQVSDDEDEDDTYIDADTTAFEVFTGEEGEELSEVGRVRSAPASDNRYQPY
jgi:nucleotide-sensitive chloride channel 1A